MLSLAILVYEYWLMLPFWCIWEFLPKPNYIFIILISHLEILNPSQAFRQCQSIVVQLLDASSNSPWHMTHDKWHVTHSVGWTSSQNFSSLALTVWDWQCLEYISTNHHLVNDEAVYRTAPASPGLLNSRLLERCCLLYRQLVYLSMRSAHKPSNQNINLL